MRRRDAAALLIATITAFAGLIAWMLGDVDMGLRLGPTSDGFVQVTDVAPDSLAEYYGFMPGDLVVELRRRDGSPMPQRDSGIPNAGDVEQAGGSLRLATGDAPPEPEIDELYAVRVESDGSGSIGWGSSLDRSQVASRLGSGGVLLLVGIGLGLAVGAAVSRGWAGDAPTADATVAAVAVATPLMVVPLLFAGSPLTIASGLALPALGALPLAWSLAELQDNRAWVAILRWASASLAGVALLLAGRTLFLWTGIGVQGQLVLLAAAVVATPSVAGALLSRWSTSARLGILALGALPAAAALSLASPMLEYGALALSIGAVLAWRIGARFLTARTPRHDAQPVPPATDAEALIDADPPRLRARRDTVAVVVAGLTLGAGLLSCCNQGAVVSGAVFGAIVSVALHRGLMGPAWSRVAVPVGCAVATPLMALALDAGGTQYLLRLLLPAASALPVAHYLAWRHPEPIRRRILFVGSLALVGTVVLLVSGSSVGGPIGGPYELGDSGARLLIYLALGFVALAPGLGATMASDAPGGPAMATGRLDLVAIGLTPGAAMTVLPGYAPTYWLLGLWLLVLVAWRRFTIAPLLGLAQRSQRQRDLAVAAVEAERARLAADIHDDALQELAALVQRLDTAGDAEGAELARSVAERLRAITSDLRLPLLDDLGAGPALEWLVGRFQPLTPGEVRLERSDPSRPPAGVELAVFRVAQEAIANAVKHGKPPITVRYRVDDGGGVSLSVDDEGPGIEADAPETALRAGHLGVANMQQRAEQIGALLDIRRWPGGGTHVALEWRPQ
jgi:signal transduction histidine kinase